MRQRRQHERTIELGGAGHQITQMVGDHETHLPVGQNGGLGSPGRAGGEEQPAGAVRLHGRVRNDATHLRIDQRGSSRSFCLPLGFPGEPDALSPRDGPAHRLCIFREVGLAEEDPRPGHFGHVGHVVRHHAKVCRHPDPADPEGGQHRLQHLIAVLAVHQHRFARLDAKLEQRAGQCRYPPVQLRPAPGLLTPHQCSALRKAPGVLREEVSEVHSPPRYRRLMDRLHFARSRIET